MDWYRPRHRASPEAPAGSNPRLVALESGLLVPEHALRVPQRVAPEPSLASVLAAPGLADLGHAPGTLADIVELISAVPFSSAMLATGVLDAELHHHPRDRERHAALAEVFYPEPHLGAILGFMLNSPTHLAFDPRHVATLQRLLVMHAADDDGSVALGRDGAARLGLALLRIASALPHGDPPAHVPQTAAEWAAWARFILVIGAWHIGPEIGDGVARAHALYADVHGDPLLAGERSRCDLDGWMRESYGLTLTEQLAGALACAAITNALDASVETGARFRHIEPGFLGPGALAGKEPELVRLISATREELVDLGRDGADDPVRLAWDHTLFEQRPFLRDGDDRLRLISARGLVSWATRGMHHRALQAAETQPHPRKAGRSMSSIFLSYAGRLGEEAVRRLIARSLAAQTDRRVVRVHGEHEYRTGKDRKDSPDILLDFGDELVVIEVYSGRFSRNARTRLDADELRKALDKGTTAKLAELAKQLRALLAGELIYDGVELPRVRRVWPLVVLAGDPILQTPALWHYLLNAVPEAFAVDARVRRPFILDLDDLDALLVHVEAHDRRLPEMLDGLAASRFADAPPRNWVQHELGAVPHRPAYASEQLERAVRLAGMAHFPGSERLASWTADERAA
jgi:hypothetical protein